MKRLLLASAALLSSLAAPSSFAAAFECQLPDGTTTIRSNGCLEGEDTLRIYAPSTLPPLKAKPAPPKKASSSESFYTVAGRLACRSNEWYDEAVQFYVAEDRGSFNAYLSAGKCVVLEGGKKVTVLDREGFLGSKVVFAINGVKLWGSRESLR